MIFGSDASASRFIYETAAAHSAQELIDNALTHDRFGPADLAGPVALTEIVMRAGPSRRYYAALPNDL